MPVGKGVNMRTVEKRFMVEGTEAKLYIDREDAIVTVNIEGSDDPHVANVLSFLLGDKDIKKLIERSVNIDTKGYKFVASGHKYYIKRKGGDGKMLLAMDRHFCLRKIKAVKAEDLYGIIEFLRKCDLDIRAGHSDGAYWFL